MIVMDMAIVSLILVLVKEALKGWIAPQRVCEKKKRRKGKERREKKW